VTDQSPFVDELGPVDYVVVEFPPDGQGFVESLLTELAIALIVRTRRACW